jgi:thymidylate synthase (FAD)
VIHAARVSVDRFNNEVSPKEAKGLINFLMKNRHGSPFEHGSMTFHVRAPIMVTREMLRHRIGWSFSEQSGRYTELKGEFYLPTTGRPVVRREGTKTGDYAYEPDTYTLHLAMGNIRKANTAAWHSYEAMLAGGVVPELARSVLPVNLFSELVVSCNPRSLMAFLSLRVDEPAATFPSKPQHEIHRVAQQMEEMFRQLMPVTHAAFIANGRVTP